MNKNSESKESNERGFWIPIEIFGNPKLSVMQKNILAQIVHLDNSERGCYASNKFFAERFNLSPGRVSQIINDLKAQGYIKISYKRHGKAITERNIKVVFSQLNRVFSELKGVFSQLKGGIYSAKGGYLENAKENNILEQYIINNISNIIEKAYFKKSLENLGLRIEKIDSKIDFQKKDFDFLKNYNEATGQNRRVLDSKTKRQLNARLKEGFTFQEIIKAAENCSKSQYHIENPGYLTPEFITRADKLQKYMNFEPANGKKVESVPDYSDLEKYDDVDAEYGFF